jgi:hypothetical protein
MTRVVVAASVGLAATVGCGGNGLDDWEPGRPRIDTVVFLSQAPDQPFSLGFSVRVTDSDGDLGLGTLGLDIAGRDVSQLSVDKIYAAQTPTVALDATQAQLEIAVDVSKNVAAGDTVDFGFQLTDRQGNVSNHPTIRLKAVAPAAKGGS